MPGGVQVRDERKDDEEYPVPCDEPTRNTVWELKCRGIALRGIEKAPEGVGSRPLALRTDRLGNKDLDDKKVNMKMRRGQTLAAELHCLAHGRETIGPLYPT